MQHVVNRHKLYMIQLQFKQTGIPETTEYTGFIMFPKAQCGGDFLKALVDGRITIDVADNKMGQYFNQYSYFRDDWGRSSATIQYG